VPDVSIRPVQRSKTASDPAKTSKWPRTARREQRIREVLERRQPDLTVVLENVHDAHNLSAVLRSCDAVGVLRVHAVYTVEPPPAALARTTSGSASKWVEARFHDSIPACYGALRAEGHHILTTALTETSASLHEVDFTGPTAVVFGNENRGASEEAIALADGTLFIPMMGMVESLNISVACAVTLYEALRQRFAAGAYDAPRLDERVLDQLRAEWLER
jgi:tRNA (guanosine-2'-O-)-methyltransferase